MSVMIKLQETASEVLLNLPEYAEGIGDTYPMIPNRESGKSLISQILYGKTSDLAGYTALVETTKQRDGLRAITFTNMEDSETVTRVEFEWK